MGGADRRVARYQTSNASIDRPPRPPPRTVCAHRHPPLCCATTTIPSEVSFVQHRTKRVRAKRRVSGLRTSGRNRLPSVKRTRKPELLPTPCDGRESVLRARQDRLYATRDSRATSGHRPSVSITPRSSSQK